MSLPSRERGLKPFTVAINEEKLVSLPSRERGLKHEKGKLVFERKQSLPSRERGLKQTLVKRLEKTEGRSPRGSVD